MMQIVERNISFHRFASMIERAKSVSINEIRGGLDDHDAITDVTFAVTDADGCTRMVMCSAETDADKLPEIMFSEVQKVPESVQA